MSIEEPDIVTEHLPVNMTSDFENCLVARSTFCQLCDQSVAIVIPAPFHLGTSARVLPCCFERGYMASWIRWSGFTSWKEIPLVLDSPKLFEVPVTMGVAIRLQEHSDMVVVGECANGEEAIQSVSTLNPDLIFLDIQMPDMSGLKMLRSLPQQSISPIVIFLTAYDEYAVAAFEVQALDYLLKPIDDERFAFSLERARRLLSLERQETLYARMQGLLEMHSEDAGPGPAKRFAVRTGNQVSFIQSADIDWVESVGDYAGLHVGNKTHLLREPLNVLESRLDRERFLRIHRSTIVHSLPDRALPGQQCFAMVAFTRTTRGVFARSSRVKYLPSSSGIPIARK